MKKTRCQHDPTDQKQSYLIDVSHSKIHESVDDPDTMKSFIEFHHSEDHSCHGDQQINESRSFLKKGAATLFAAQSRTHSKQALQSFKQAQTAVNGIEGKSSDEKLDAIAEALGGLLIGLEQMTKQANQSSAISLTTALLNERSDRQILNLLQGGKTIKSQ